MLQTWMGTPYSMSGFSKKGVGTNCVRLCYSVYDELYGMSPCEDIPRASATASLHCPTTVKSCLRHFLRRFPSRIIKNPSLLEEGDIILTPTTTGGPRVGHAMILASRQTIVHAVDQTGVTLAGRVIPGWGGAIKMLEKESWGC